MTRTNPLSGTIPRQLDWDVHCIADVAYDPLGSAELKMQQLKTQEMNQLGLDESNGSPGERYQIRSLGVSRSSLITISAVLLMLRTFRSYWHDRRARSSRSGASTSSDRTRRNEALGNCIAVAADDLLSFARGEMQ